VIRAAASAQYAELFDALPVPAYLTYGNVDMPALWAEHLRPGHRVLDGECRDRRADVRVVGGGLLLYRTPY
jgi:hypothetical protein